MNYLIVVFFIVLALTNGCKLNLHPCDYKITPKYIKTNCTLFNGLEIEKLKNVIIEDSVPKEYEIEFKASYGASGEYFEMAMKNKLNKIIFKEEITGYSWLWHGQGVISSIMPFDFEPHNWYLIGRLYENGAPSVLLYIYVNKDGSFNVYRKDTPTNW